MVSSHGCFVWYELTTTDAEAAQAFYCRCRRLGFARCVDARCGLYAVHRRGGCGRRTDGSAGRSAQNGRAATLDGLCRRRRRGCRNRQTEASRRHRVRPADGRRRCQPIFCRRRSASGNVGLGQRAELRPTAGHRAERAGPCRLARTVRRRLGTGVRVLRRAFRLAESRRRLRRHRQHLSPVLCRRPYHRRHVHQAADGADAVLALLLQCRRPRCGGKARQGRRRQNSRGTARRARRQPDRPLHGPSRRHVRAADGPPRADRLFRACRSG